MLAVALLLAARGQETEYLCLSLFSTPNCTGNSSSTCFSVQQSSATQLCAQLPTNTAGSSL